MWHRLPPPREFRQDWWPGIIPYLFTIALIAALIALAVWLIIAARRGNAFPGTSVRPPLAAPNPALHEARMRYARGDIAREQFLQMSADLGGPPIADAPPPGESG